MELDDGLVPVHANDRDVGVLQSFGSGRAELAELGGF
jgi:hypothetical protein